MSFKHQITPAPYTPTFLPGSLLAALVSDSSYRAGLGRSSSQDFEHCLKRRTNLTNALVFDVRLRVASRDDPNAGVVR